MCGIIGIYNHPEAANLAYLGLHALQHRGQESAGIISSDGVSFHHYNGMGLVQDVFTKDRLNTLPGRLAIGHVRYSTTGESHIKNAQPFVMRDAQGWLALAHNGNLTNATELRKELEQQGAVFQSTMDSEVIAQLIKNQKSPPKADPPQAEKIKNQKLEEQIIEALKRVEGAWSLVFLTDSKLIAARDPSGFRPLVIGKLDGGVIAASETTALDLIAATYLREVEPGEVVVIDKDGIKSLKPFSAPSRMGQCIFEYVYFARPDSKVFGRDVYEIRKGFGKMLARENSQKADIVVPVPDSGVPAAIGYSQESGIPFEMGLVRSHYVGRTFIEPRQEIRSFGVKLKLNPVRETLRDKRIILIDDSIVRGTTSRKIVGLLKTAGAKEVHIRISSPPTCWPCYYGIDTPTREELIASAKNVEETRRFIGADSLKYLTRNSLYWFGESPDMFCDACFTGNYPTPNRNSLSI